MVPNKRDNISTIKRGPRQRNSKTKPERKKFITEKHHRRPRSLDGSSNQGNISYVFNKQHTSWHALYANLNAVQTCIAFNKDLKDFRDSKIILKAKFINGKKVTKTGKGGAKWLVLRKGAFETLFKGLKNDLEIIKYVNNTWLDPSYHFYPIN